MSDQSLRKNLVVTFENSVLICAKTIVKYKLKALANWQS